MAEHVCISRFDIALRKPINKIVVSEYLVPIAPESVTINIQQFVDKMDFLLATDAYFLCQFVMKTMNFVYSEVNYFSFQL